MLRILLIPQYSDISLSWAIICPAISRFITQVGSTLTWPNQQIFFPILMMKHSIYQYGMSVQQCPNNTMLRQSHFWCMYLFISHHTQNVSLLHLSICTQFAKGRASHSIWDGVIMIFNFASIEQNIGISFTNVDQELWLLYVQGPLSQSYTNKKQQGNNQIAVAVF